MRISLVCAAWLLAGCRGETLVAVADVPPGPAPEPVECAVPAPCHRVFVDPQTRACVEVPAMDGAACTDACLVDAACHAGICTGSAKRCDDHDACTADACGPDGCLSTPVACPAATDPCQVAFCSPTTGCGLTDLPDGTACGVSDCASAQVCLAGRCQLRPAPSAGACEGIAAGGRHACRLVEGTVRCFGSNDDGALGAGDDRDTEGPVAVVGLPSTVRVVEARATLTCAIADGAAWCWGELVNSPPFDRAHRMPGFESGVTAIAVGTSFLCAIVDGAVKCAGPSDWPEVLIAEGATAIAASGRGACASAQGRIWCWGASDAATFTTAVPLLTFFGRPNPTAAAIAATAGGADRLAMNAHQICALRAGIPHCWSGDAMEHPVVEGVTGVTALTSDEDVVCAVGSQAPVCWDAQRTVRPLPPLAAPVTRLALGGAWSCALSGAGAVCWGVGPDSAAPIPAPQ